MAEPFWYVDSPLTTPDPARPFPGRPPKGEMPPAVPGVLVPDAPVRLAGQPEVGRLRQVARDGLLVLVTGGLDPAGVAATVKETTDAPARVAAVADIDADGTVAGALDAHPGEAWIIRPDGHIGAVLTRPTATAVAQAVRRLLGRHAPAAPAD
jgi:hypothetical protein